METLFEIYAWLVEFFETGSFVLSWLSTPINIGDFGSFSPLGLLTLTGIIAFIPVSIAKWIFS